jgi:hypothetical protein
VYFPATLPRVAQSSSSPKCRLCIPNESAGHRPRGFVYLLYFIYLLYFLLFAHTFFTLSNTMLVELFCIQPLPHTLANTRDRVPSSLAVFTPLFSLFQQRVFENSFAANNIRTLF